MPLRLTSTAIEASRTTKLINCDFGDSVKGEEGLENMPSEEIMTEIVRRARCIRCDGKGFKIVPAEDHRGERIPGEFDKVDCRDCDGNGIKLGVCRRLAVELNGHPK